MFSWCSAPEAEAEEFVRTAKESSLTAKKALKALKKGNERYVGNEPMQKTAPKYLRKTLATDGQNPFAAIIGCADSRCPLETLFDAQPGDIFALRNAGNAVTHPNGSIVGSIEFAVGALGTKLVLVLGHTKCGAMAGATSAMLGKLGPKNGALETYLKDLAPVAERAMKELPAGSSADDIAKHAIRVNVFNTMEKLMSFSPPLREKVAAGEVEVHGAVYEIASGEVQFLGQHPKLGEILSVKGVAGSAMGA